MAEITKFEDIEALNLDLLSISKQVSGFITYLQSSLLKGRKR